MENKRLSRRKKTPINGEKAPRIECSFPKRASAYYPPPPTVGAHMGEYGICYKIHNIFGNYSSYNDIKVDSKMQPIERFLKNFLRRAYTFEFTIIKIEQRYIHRTIDKQAGCITRIPLHYLKNYTPMFEHGSEPIISQHSATPPSSLPDNNRVCECN